MQLNIRLMTVDLLWMASVFFVVACGLKFLGAALPFRWMFNVSGKVAGLLFNYRLSFGIITTVGLKVGLLTEDLYAVVLLIVIASALLRLFCCTIVPPSGNSGYADRPSISYDFGSVFAPPMTTTASPRGRSPRDPLPVRATYRVPPAGIFCQSKQTAPLRSPKSSAASAKADRPDEGSRR